MSDFALSDLPGRGAERPAAERGELSIDDRVITKLARQAGADIDGSVRHSAGIGPLGSRYPDASVRTIGNRVWVELDVAGAWPCNLAEIGDRARTDVTRRLTELAGVHVERMDVTVHVVTADEKKEGRVR